MSEQPSIPEDHHPEPGSVPGVPDDTPLAAPEPIETGAAMPTLDVTAEAMTSEPGAIADAEVAADDTPTSAPDVRTAAVGRTPRRGWWERVVARRVPILFVLILALAAALRFVGLDWDQHTHINPDERFLTMVESAMQWPSSLGQYLDEAHSPLNPRNVGYSFFVYGTLPTTIIRVVAGATSQVGYDQVYLVGRFLSGLFDIGSIVFLFLLARRLYRDNRVALLASFLLATSVLAIQYAHFMVVDPYANFFITGALYFLAGVQLYGRKRDYALSGLFYGMALATKLSIYAFALIVALVVLYRLWRLWAAEPSFEARWSGVKQAVVRGLLLALAAFAAFRFGQPDAFRGPGIFDVALSDRWLQNAQQASQMVSGNVDFPPNDQWTARVPLWFPWSNMVLWGMGLPLGLAAWAGWGVAAWRVARRREWVHLIPATWVALVFLQEGTQWVKTLRYFLPIYPTLALLAAWLLVWLWDRARARQAAAATAPATPGDDSAALPSGPAPAGVPRPTPRARRAGSPLAWTTRKATALVLIVTVGTLLWALAFEHIYLVPHSRVQASRWIYTHIPPGKALTLEGWDDSLPLPVDGKNPSAIYKGVTMNWYDDDTPQKYQQALGWLDQAGYIIESSNRLYGSIPRLPMRYPMTIRYYKALFDGSLGFKRVAVISSYPQLFGIQIPDQGAEEAFTVYDHPLVTIFEKTPAYSRQRAARILGNVDWAAIVRASPKDVTTIFGTLKSVTPAVAAYDPSHSMVLPQKVDQANQKAPTYNAVFPPDNPLARIPLLSWLVMVELLGLLALPLVMRACRGALRDGGYALAKLCGIIIVGYLTWLAASMHVAVYSRGLILVSCLTVLLLSLAFGLRPRALWTELRARRQAVLWAELIFVAGFLVMAGLRMAYPDLWHMTYGGERTQEVSFINAILRSQHFPPYDPWFAGGTLNYYYYGLYLTGMLMKLVGIPVSIGFNLALPTLYALVLSIAFSIGYNATGRIWVGVTALSLEGVLGNLGPIQQLAALNPAHATAALPLIGGLRDAFGGLIAVLTHQVQLPSDFFWTSSRILSIGPADAINEFPIWSFTYGDMHAHVIDMPILLGVIGLALAISGLGAGDQPSNHSPDTVPATRARGSPSGELPPQAATRGRARRPRSNVRMPQLLLLVALTAVVAGATGPTNLWDLPTAIVILTAGFGLRGWFVARRSGWALLWRYLALPGIVLGLLCLILYRPFYSTVLGISSGFTFLTPHTPTDAYLLHFGLPLFLLTSFFLIVLGRRARRFITVLEFRAYYSARRERLPRLFRLVGAMIGPRRPDAAPPRLLSALVVIVGTLVTLALIVVGFTTLALIAALLTLGTTTLLEVSTRARPADLQESQPFALVLAVLGLALTALPDVVMQNEAGRMNTFFKLYNQAWPLLALSGALALSALVRMRRRAAPATAAARYRAALEVKPVPAPALTSALVARPLSWASSSADDGAATPWAWRPGAPGEGRVLDVATAQPEERPAPEPAGAAPDGAAHLAVREGGAPVARARRRGSGPSTERMLWWAVLTVLVCGAIIFPIFGTYSHLQLRSDWNQTAMASIPDGLDGAAFMRVLYPGDAAAIDWINGHLTGTPVLLTSGRGGYRNFAAKVTMFTGLPSVSPGTDWSYEDSQERYSGQARPGQYPATWVNQFDSGRVTWNGTRWVMNLPQAATPALGTRSSDVETIYNTRDPAQALALLHEYHVSYVYVGTAERGDPFSGESGNAAYGNRNGFNPAGLAKFDRMTSAGQLRLRYDRLGVKIYQVI